MLKIKKISIICIALLLSCSILLPVSSLYAYAEDRQISFSVSAGASTIYVGDSTTVTVSISGMIGRFDVSGAVNDSFWSPGSVIKTYTINGDAEGNKTVTVASSNVSDDDGNMLDNQKKSVTVNIIANNSGGGSGGNSGGNSGGSSSGGGSGTTTNQNNNNKEDGKSSNANLSILSISEGDLNPAFSADVTDYTVTLGKEASSITVNASASDANASVSGTGEHALQSGKNEITIAVTAEDGTVKNYVITVNVEEAPDIFVNYNDKKLGVVKDTSDASIPDTFEETTVTLSGSEIKAWHSNLRNLTIVYMVDEANEKNFYLYDESAKTITSIYKPIGFMGRNVAIIDVPKELQTRAGMTFTEIDIDGMKFPGWTYESKTFENYALLYLMDDQGKVHYYQYEKSEGTLQLFSDAAPITQSEYEAAINESNDKLQQRMWMIIALLVTNVITIALLLYVMMKKRKTRKKRIAHTGSNTELEKFEDDAVILNTVERISGDDSSLQNHDESDGEA